MIPRRVAVVPAVTFALFTLVGSFANARADEIHVRQSFARCTGGQITVRVGLVHAAAVTTRSAAVALENASQTACLIDPFAPMQLDVGSQSAIDIAVDTPFERPAVDGRRLPLGHGPATFPIVLAAGSRAVATLRWIGTATSDARICVDATSFSVSIGGERLRSPLPTKVCGRDARTLGITTTRFVLDPK